MAKGGFGATCRYWASGSGVSGSPQPPADRRPDLPREGSEAKSESGLMPRVQDVGMGWSRRKPGSGPAGSTSRAREGLVVK